jgi:hypothetical protein
MRKPTLNEAAAALGKKGGLATGESKRRGTSEYYRELQAKAAESRRANATGLKEMNAKRIAAGLCRHCGGAVPCWSPFGDISVGVKHKP